MRFDFIRQHPGGWPVEVMGRVLEVTRQGFYAWLKRPPSASHQRRAERAKKAERIHQESRKTYGSPRGPAQLKEEGEVCSVNTIGSVMRENAIWAGETKTFRPRPDRLESRLS
jgi:hypothetical protein